MGGRELDFVDANWVKRLILRFIDLNRKRKIFLIQLKVNLKIEYIRNTLHKFDMEMSAGAFLLSPSNLPTALNGRQQAK